MERIVLLGFGLIVGMFWAYKSYENRQNENQYQYQGQRRNNNRANLTFSRLGQQSNEQVDEEIKRKIKEFYLIVYEIENLEVNDNYGLCKDQLDKLKSKLEQLSEFILKSKYVRDRENVLECIKNQKEQSLVILDTKYIEIIRLSDKKDKNKLDEFIIESFHITSPKYLDIDMSSNNELTDKEDKLRQLSNYLLESDFIKRKNLLKEVEEITEECIDIITKKLDELKMNELYEECEYNYFSCDDSEFSDREDNRKKKNL